jgi:hypothetical protein
MDSTSSSEIGLIDESEESGSADPNLEMSRNSYVIWESYAVNIILVWGKNLLLRDINQCLK